MKNPKYRAYKPVMVTDGIFTWQQDSLDNTVGAWTDADIDKFQAGIQSCAPFDRIATIQARLDSLKKPTPGVEMYADAIRTILAGLSNHHSLNLKEARGLAEAEMLWDKLIIVRDVMPKAVQGLSQSKAQSDRAKLRRFIIAGIKEKLSGEHPDYSAKELWPHLYDKLDEMTLDPEVKDDVPGKESYIYDHNGKRKTISFGAFANIKIKNKSR